VFSDAEVTKFTDLMGQKMKDKFFNQGDLAFLSQSFDNELASGKPNFSTMEKRLDLFGSSAPVAPKPEADNGSTNVEVTVNVGGRPTTGSTSGTTSPASDRTLSPLASDVYGALKSMHQVDYSLQRAIRNGDINKYSIGTMQAPGAWTRVTAANVGARGIVVGPELSQSQLNKAVIEALNKMLGEYEDELDEAQKA